MVHPTSPTVAIAPRVIEPRNAYIMKSMLKEVATRGTARKAAELNRKDIGGKTGTTNNQLDAWFTGFGSNLVATAWVGSDGLTPLGRGEAGGKVALPMWIRFMSDVLPDYGVTASEEPEGMKTVRIDRNTGEAADGGTSESMLELFLSENAPQSVAAVSRSSNSNSGSTAVVVQPTTKSQKKKRKKQVDSLF